MDFLYFLAVFAIVAAWPTWAVWYQSRAVTRKELARRHGMLPPEMRGMDADGMAAVYSADELLAVLHAVQKAHTAPDELRDALAIRRAVDALESSR